jgi:hypothetical protein
LGRCPLLLNQGPIPPLEDGETLDLSRLEWATPFDIAAMASLYLSAVAEGRVIEVIPPADLAVRRYLVDAGLSGLLGGEWPTASPPPVEPPLIPLTRVRRSHEWDDLMSATWPDIAIRIGSTSRRAFDILGELVDNATTHGFSDVGTLVIAQRYTGATSGLDPGLWLAVVDAGVGIPEHLRRNPTYGGVDSDVELLRRSREPWVTGTTERRGWGLHEVFDNVKEIGHSAMTFRSGRARGQFQVGPQGALRAAYWMWAGESQGTWVNIRLPNVAP